MRFEEKFIIAIIIAIIVIGLTSKLIESYECIVPAGTSNTFRRLEGKLNAEQESRSLEDQLSACH